MLNNAYITLVSSQDYLIAALVLGLSLNKVKSQYPLIICYTNNVDIETFQKIENIKYQLIPTIQYNNFIRQQYNNNHLINTASKVGIFTIQNYDNLLYIDADGMILENIDNIFNDYLDGSILWLWDEHCQNHIGMSAMFLFSPKNHNYSMYKTIVENYNGLDGDLFDSIFFACKNNNKYRIPEIYFQSFNLVKGKEKGIHFVGDKKPWQQFSIKNKYEIYYQQLLKEVRQYATI